MLPSKILYKSDDVIEIYDVITIPSIIHTKIIHKEKEEQKEGVLSVRCKYFLNQCTYRLKILHNDVKRIKTKSQKVK